MSDKTILPSIALSRAMLATAPGKNKLSLILDSADPQAFVRRLPAEDLYFAIKEIGIQDAVDVVALASPSQFRAFVDLDVWEQHLPEPEQILKWLQVALDGRRDDSDFRQKRAALDRELILVVLKTQTIVHSLEENDDPILISNNYVRTAEGKYLVEINAEGEEGVTIRNLIDDFIDEDPFIATRLFEAVRWEQKSELEETALRWRTGRLRDMGFPTFEEATRIWAPLPATWKAREAAPEVGIVSGVPALLLVTSRTPLLLDRVVERLPDSARAFFNEGLLYLLNCAIVADGIDPKDLDLARSTLAAARDMLSLGLELAADGNEETALAVVMKTPAVELFRLAVGRVAVLKKHATATLKPFEDQKVARFLFDSPDEELLAGIRRRRPRQYDPEGPGERSRPDAIWRAFRSRADIATAEAAIGRARACLDVVALLGLDPATGARLADAAGRALSAVSFSQILLTAAVRAPKPIEPLSREEVAALCSRFESGRLTERAKTDYAQFADGLRGRLDVSAQAAFATVATRAFERFADELGAPCAAGGLDVRFVECVLVAPLAAEATAG